MYETFPLISETLKLTTTYIHNLKILKNDNYLYFTCIITTVTKFIEYFVI